LNAQQEAPWAAFELALRVTLLAAALDPPLLWFERMPVLVLAGLGLAVPAALRSRALWAGLLALAMWPLVFHWPISDNHDYLSALWCLAALCALASADPPAALAHHGRRLIGLTFAFATLWKLLLAPDFLDGRFFRVTLLTDARFENLAVLAGGMSHEDWARNDLAVDELLAGEATFEGSRFVEPPELRRLACALTLFTGAIEAAVAAAFLWRRGSALSRARHALLLGFAAATFSFATVRGFGWLLMSMGLAQCEPERRRTRAAYLAVFALIALYRSVPWSGALIEWLRPGA
jgi:hypothetical protein